MRLAGWQNPAPTSQTDDGTGYSIRELARSRRYALRSITVLENNVGKVWWQLAATGRVQLVKSHLVELGHDLIDRYAAERAGHPNLKIRQHARPANAHSRGV